MVTAYMQAWLFGPARHSLRIPAPLSGRPHEAVTGPDGLDVRPVFDDSIKRRDFERIDYGLPHYHTDCRVDVAPAVVMDRHWRKF